MTTHRVQHWQSSDWWNKVAWTRNKRSTYFESDHWSDNRLTCPQSICQSGEPSRCRGRGAARRFDLKQSVISWFHNSFGTCHGTISVFLFVCLFSSSCVGTNLGTWYAVRHPQTREEPPASPSLMYCNLFIFVLLMSSCWCWCSSCWCWCDAISLSLYF